MSFHIFPATGFRPGNTLIIFLVVLHCSGNTVFFNLQAVLVPVMNQLFTELTYSELLVLPPETIRQRS
jgi:hypothetical protein